MILLIDNYDSFVFNLAHYIEMHEVEVLVTRNDKVSVAEVSGLKPEGIVLSPGPGTPEEAGICVELIQAVGRVIPILGVCLGHQAIGVAFGGKVIRSFSPQHGSSSNIFHQGAGVFEGLPSPFPAGRYHSLIVEETELPQELLVTARTAGGTIMGLQHKNYPVHGVQFHPESILTEHGIEIIQNFLELAGIKVSESSAM